MGNSPIKVARAQQINHNYLREQFSDSEEIFNEIKTLVRTGDFTLGKVVDEFETEFSKFTKTKFCVGVGSATDAIFLSLKALGIEDGDEIVNCSYPSGENTSPIQLFIIHSTSKPNHHST